MLNEPEKIYQIVSSVRDAIGHEQQLSVKIRLGFDDTSLFGEIIDAIASSQANMLSIHARTKKQGYKAPAHWQYIHKAIALLKNSKNYALETNDNGLAVIANGEIWTKEDAQQCKDKAGTSNIMLGRGALASPDLAHSIKLDKPRMKWSELSEFLLSYSELELQGDKSFYYSSRLKQWLRYIRLQYPQAEQLFQSIKLLKNKDEIITQIQNLSNT